MKEFSILITLRIISPQQEARLFEGRRGGIMHRGLLNQALSLTQGCSRKQTEHVLLTYQPELSVSEEGQQQIQAATD